MIILFDNNGFAHLAQHSPWASHLQRLKELVDRKKVTVVGSCTMLYELAGLAQMDTALYLKTLSEYEQVIQGKVLKQSEALVIGEVEQHKTIGFEASLLNKASVQAVLSGFKDPAKADALYCEAKSLKQNYAGMMDLAHDEIVTRPSIANDPVESLPPRYKNWFKDFDGHIQDWFVHMFNVESNVIVKDLHHVSAFLGYALTRVYERFCFNVKDRDNDHFDRAHFTDAAVVDVLVTNDKAFRRTALMVPNRMFDVKDVGELSVFMEELCSC